MESLTLSVLTQTPQLSPDANFCEELPCLTQHPSYTSLPPLHRNLKGTQLPVGQPHRSSLCEGLLPDGSLTEAASRPEVAGMAPGRGREAV